MKTFSEARGDTAVFTFGRFNPPTTGHEKLIDALAKQQGKNAGSLMYVYPSHSQDAKKNPLPHSRKVAYMKKMFRKYAKNIITSKSKNVFDIAVELHNKGHRAVVMVVGSDRVEEFDRLLNTYNGVDGKHGYYGFDDIRVVSAGERDPDAEGVEGMSASKMRAAAAQGDFDSFKMGLPTNFGDAKKLYDDVRKNMGVREQNWTDEEIMRDAYIRGEVWNVGDVVETKLGDEGKIIRKGTNYVVFENMQRVWLHDLALDERNYASEYKNYHSSPEQIARRSSRNKARRVMGIDAIKGMDVGHKDNNPMNNDPDNLRNEDPSDNRREPRLREEPKKITKTKQAKGDVADVKGTQPAKYYSKDAEGDDMSKSTKIARARHFAKGGSRDNAPGDKDAKTKPSQYTKKFKQMYGEKRAKQAVSQGKVQKLVTAHGLKYDGKVYKEIDMELVKIDNSSEMVTFNIIHPKEIFGKEVKIAFKALRRGPFMATDTSKINEQDDKEKAQSDVMKDREQLKDLETKKRIATLSAKIAQDQEKLAKLQIRDKQDKDRNKSEDIEEKDNPCWDTHKQVGMKKKNGKMVPNCVPKESYEIGKDYAQHTFKIDPYSAPENLDEKIEGLVNKSEQTGVPYGILKKSYDRGMAAWKGGHRPGASQQQWAFARVNSMLTGGKADPDLQKQIKDGGYKKKKKASKESIEEWYSSDETIILYQGRYGDEWLKKLNNTYKAMLSKLDEEPCCEDCDNLYDHIIEAAEYQGKKVKLNDPIRTSENPKKKFKVYVKNEKGTVVVVRFGDPNMGINRDDPEARKAFRSRHSCDDNPGPKWKARYWSCYQWRAGAEVDN